MGYRARYQDETRLDKHTAKKAGDFLFDFPEKQEDIKGNELEFSQGLEARTRIMGSDTMGALAFYGILRDYYDCESARIVTNILSRLMISAGSLNGRSEAVEILRNSLPREVEINRGVA